MADIINLPTAAPQPVKNARRHGPLPRHIPDLRKAIKLRAYAEPSQQTEAPFDIERTTSMALYGNADDELIAMNAGCSVDLVRGIRAGRRATLQCIEHAIRRLKEEGV